MSTPAVPGIAPATGHHAEVDPALLAQPLPAWLDAVRAQVLAGRALAAGGILEAALTRFAFDAELWLAASGSREQRGDADGAIELLRELSRRAPGHAAATFALARLLSARRAWRAAAQVLVDAFEPRPPAPDLVLRAARLLADWGDKPAAVKLAEAALAAGADDAMLRLYTAALQGQLGAFERARTLYREALAGDARTLELGAAYGLASITRYRDPADPDLAHWQDLLQRGQLNPAARASLLFALGKAHDDLADYAAAARLLREANALVGAGAWSRRNWRRSIDARLARAALPVREPMRGECVPIFIVGAPRSGTTLVAELLGRSPLVRNRGELDWLPHLAEQVDGLARPTPAQLEPVAQEYLARLRREDTDSGWFIDKQPLNVLHLDLIRALFPQAPVVVCRRSARDTALSLWSQHFEARDYRFAYDFADIDAFLRGCARLVERAQQASAARVFVLDYEVLVREPRLQIARLAQWLGLPAFDCEEAAAAGTSVIGTASLWQARQPVHARSVGRWRHYAPHLPELLKFDDAAAEQTPHRSMR